MNLDAEFSVLYTHRLRCTRDVFDPANRTIADLVEPIGGQPAKVVAFVDQGVAQSQPQLIAQIDRYAAAHGERMRLTAPPQRVSGGEAIKNNPHKIEAILQTIDNGRLCRRSYVIVVGGGAVLDAVGLAAALAHRGVRLIRVATTTLAQADSAMGVKNSINAFGRKNYLGTFDVPFAVINDEAMLETLSDREWRNGFVEAVKVALLKDADLFDRIEREATRIRGRDIISAVPIIRQSAKLHFDHITQNGDPFERTEARPLDFGHWAGHKLEQLTDHELHHGEAVAIGLAIDVTYANLKGWLGDHEHRRILTCLEMLGFELNHPLLCKPDLVLAGIEEFREHLGGELTIPMIRGIGQPFDVNEIDDDVMRQAMDQLTYPEKNRACTI